MTRSLSNRAIQIIFCTRAANLGWITARRQRYLATICRDPDSDFVSVGPTDSVRRVIPLSVATLEVVETMYGTIIVRQICTIPERVRVPETISSP